MPAEVFNYVKVHLADASEPQLWKFSLVVHAVVVERTNWTSDVYDGSSGHNVVLRVLNEYNVQRGGGTGFLHIIILAAW